MTMNKSEQLLKTWCSQNGWLCERIPEEPARTPDYRINISGTKLYAEVKEIVANEEEVKVNRHHSPTDKIGTASSDACSGLAGE
jgi:hypothetical protein